MANYHNVELLLSGVVNDSSKIKDRKSVQVAAPPPPPVSILRNGKLSQRRITTVGSGKRFKQDNADLMDVG